MEGMSGIRGKTEGVEIGVGRKEYKVSISTHIHPHRGIIIRRGEKKSIGEGDGELGYCSL